MMRWRRSHPKPGPTKHTSLLAHPNRDGRMGDGGWGWRMEDGDGMKEGGGCNGSSCDCVNIVRWRRGDRVMTI